jgi:hypothetical protein
MMLTMSTSFSWYAGNFAETSATSFHIPQSWPSAWPAFLDALTSSVSFFAASAASMSPRNNSLIASTLKL